IPGAWLMLGLKGEIPHMDEVVFVSNLWLIMLTSSRNEKDELIEDLARGFSSEYMDAEGTVIETISELREYIDLYAAAKGHWTAPYTGFVTSSMMGKSRHMKEVANHL